MFNLRIGKRNLTSWRRHPIIISQKRQRYSEKHDETTAYETMKHYGALRIWCGLTQLSLAWVEELCYCGKLCPSLPFLDINAVYWDLVYLLHRLKCSFYSCGPRQNINVFGISESEVFGSYYCPTGKRLLLPFTRRALCAVMIYSFQPIYSASRLKI